MNTKELEETSSKLNLHLRLSVNETSLLRRLADGEQMSVTGYLRLLLKRAGYEKVSAIAQAANADAHECARRRA